MHTPGKWTVKKASYIGSYEIEEFSERADRMAVKNKNLKSLFIEDNANINLIASAPELLEACKISLRLLNLDGDDGVIDSMATLVKAIAKAESEV